MSSIAVIVFYGTPFKVFNTIVDSVLVLMIYNGIVMWIGDECFCNETVNKEMLSNLVYRKVYRVIP